MPRSPSFLLTLLASSLLAAGCVPAGEGDDDALVAPPGDDDASPADDDASPGDDDASPASLAALPARLLLGEGDSRTLELRADGAAVDPALAAWSADDPGVASVVAGVVTGGERGETTVRAAYGGLEIAVPVEVALLEARGLWVTRWTIGAASDEGDVEALIDSIADAGFNQVYFQVRGTFDALYRSSLEPWSSVLDGLGVDPGWDPLDVAVTRAHARGIELHAYLNTFPFWSGTTPPTDVVPPHPYDVHPEWRVADASGIPMALNSNYVFASPGSAEVRDWVAAVAEDVVTAYDVDGVHLDYVRYPGSQYSHDDASEAAYAAALAGEPGLSWEDFQRRAVTATVAGVSGRVWAVRPEVKVTAAVWGIYENRWGWSSVSQGNLDYYQDSGAFMDEGVADAILPMIYWPLTDPPGQRLDWRALADDHLARGDAAGRHVYAGICVDSETCPDNDFGEIAAEVEVARELGAAGVTLFDYSLMAAGGWLDDLAAGPFSEPARVPPMPWKGE